VHTWSPPVDLRGLDSGAASLLRILIALVRSVSRSSALDTKLNAMKAELKPAVLATGSSLMEVYGIGPAAAGVLADAADIARFSSRSHFAS
jgi:hypothetical protein